MKNMLKNYVLFVRLPCSQVFIVLFGTAYAIPAERLSPNTTPKPTAAPEKKTNHDVPMFDINCRQTLIDNGVFAMKNCSIVQTSGKDKCGERIDNSQQVQQITLQGINPTGSSEAKDNLIKNVQLMVFPFGTITSIPVFNNTGEVDGDKE